jgi:pimeloyl-ACP methyl ester carboxylesterase
MSNRPYALLALTAALLAPTTSWAAALTCLIGTDPVVLSDADQIVALRLQVEANCECAFYDASGKGKKHGDFVRCAKAVIEQAVIDGTLRKQCKGHLKKTYAKSTCGFPITLKGPKVPCVKKILKNNKTRCAVKPDQRCVDKPGIFTQDACNGHTFCQDAGDDDGDGLLAEGDSGSCTPLAAQHLVISLPGEQEPHTPGSGDPLEFATPANVTNLVGANPDLNRVTIIRSTLPNPEEQARRVVLIVIPGFLSGASFIQPLASDLAEQSNGEIEVWSVDRRPNQLEDRLGTLHGLPGTTDAMNEGVQFYFDDVDNAPLDNFPGTEDLDVNLDGDLDTVIQLTDKFGVQRGFIKMTQDDMRYAAYWGVDTYVRDWKRLVDLARTMVGPTGLVLLGGHSMGTTWAGVYAAYDLDPTAGVDAGYSSIDGLVMIEGPGPRAPSSPPSLSEYNTTVADLATPGGPDVFMTDFNGIELFDLGSIGELSAIAAVNDPTGPAIAQRTPVFGSGVFATLLGAPANNRAIVGFFIDDDFSPQTSFRASAGFSLGPNAFLAASPPFFQDSFYSPQPDVGLRTWMEFDDPQMPSCPPNFVSISPGCAIVDNGPPSVSPDPPKTNGVEREVSNLDDFLVSQFGAWNGLEWYFLSGRVSLDLSYGRDSSSLGDESLLAVTQNANVDVPVLCIGGSNGLTPQASSFDNYLSSIATPAPDKRIEILSGYAHLDPVLATNNEAATAILDWVQDLQGP